MKKKIFRGFSMVSILFILVCTLSNNSWAQQKKYPLGSIDLLCGFPAGGQTDLANRALAKGLEKVLGVTVVPVNKPGAGGLISITALANASPDGYTLGMFSDGAIISILLGQATYTMDGFRIIGTFACYDNVIVTSADLPWKNIQDLVDYARKNPGVKFGHPGVTTATFMYAESLNKHAKLGMINLPFKGDPEIIAAVLGRHVPIGVFGYMNGKIQADAGKMKILFCFNGYDPAIPSISTTFGKSVPVIDLPWYLAVPRKTPDEIFRILEQALEKVTKDPDNWRI